MAVPRSMRVLAGLSAVLFCYLLLQIFRTPKTLPAPENKLADVTRDPNLDRE